MRGRMALLVACALAGCGGGESDEREPAAAKPQKETTAAPREDTLDAVAARAAEEVPGCTRYARAKLPAGARKAGLVGMMSTPCEDDVLVATAIYRFRDEKAAAASSDQHAIIDNPRARNGAVVAAGNSRCHEESIRGKDAVSCMLTVKRYIVAASGKPGVDTDDVVNQRIPALARAAE